MATNPTVKLANEVRLACQRVSHAVRFDSRSSLAPHQLGVLWQLKRGPRTPGELAASERVTAPSMTKTLHGLEELGLITRTKDPNDGRRRNVVLTDEGHAELRRTASIRDSFMEERLARLNDEERTILRKAAALLQAVIE